MKTYGKNILIYYHPLCYLELSRFAAHLFILILFIGKDGCFNWHLPDYLPPGSCDLSVEGSTDDDSYNFSEEREIEVVDTHQITFIHTDRPFYKPGQLGESF